MHFFDYGYGRAPFKTTVYEAYEGNNRMLEYSLRIRPDGTAKNIYEMLDSDEAQIHSFVFNAKFNPYKTLVSYESAMIVKGYVESVEEDIVVSELLHQDGSGGHTTLRVRILATSIEHTDGENTVKITL